jgi:glutamate racemase
MMDNPILFIDSGIGGIPYCSHFFGRNPGAYIVYLADRLHFPYGKWEKTELAEIIKKLVEQLVNVINPKIVVLACNTATIAALAELRECFPALPFVGTVPAIKPAALASKTGKIGVLGTELTIKQPYIRDLASRFGSGEVFGIAAPELVEFIESCFDSASSDEKKDIVTTYLNHFRAEGVDTLVLGCTHFLFLLDEFQREAAPDITVFDSVPGITHRIESLLGGQKEKSDRIPRQQNRILLTGPSVPEPSWVSLAGRLGFSLSLLDQL